MANSLAIINLDRNYWFGDWYPNVCFYGQITDQIWNRNPVKPEGTQGNSKIAGKPGRKHTLGKQCGLTVIMDWWQAVQVYPWRVQRICQLPFKPRVGLTATSSPAHTGLSHGTLAVSLKSEPVTFHCHGLYVKMLQSKRHTDFSIIYKVDRKNAPNFDLITLFRQGIWRGPVKFYVCQREWSPLLAITPMLRIRWRGRSKASLILEKGTMNEQPLAIFSWVQIRFLDNCMNVYDHIRAAIRYREPQWHCVGICIENSTTVQHVLTQTFSILFLPFRFIHFVS